ncbi:hypothetical protein L0663_09085 [Dyadobacter sp. CY107]|uniref:hypothetical protein n=1 Tax=Dyadobacter fanqingshengii TaxID=2906443 RepID=UPI001F437B8E|nr:hypothetical protein [Dyadobacter fanqingshengii]MCF2503527.1 hypothetical protein [Dyadobacter fanqingshengii]
MNDLMQTFNQLSEYQQKQLLAYADGLLLQQKAKKGDGDLSKWKENILNVSTWSENDIATFEENIKGMDNWKAPQW